MRAPRLIAVVGTSDCVLGSSRRGGGADDGISRSLASGSEVTVTSSPASESSARPGRPPREKRARAPNRRNAFPLRSARTGPVPEATLVRAGPTSQRGGRFAPGEILTHVNRAKPRFYPPPRKAVDNVGTKWGRHAGFSARGCGYCGGQVVKERRKPQKNRGQTRSVVIRTLWVSGCDGPHNCCPEGRKPCG